jgi:hypothetical protein
MWLLKRLLHDNFELVSFNDDDVPPYAILSHTWMEGEVTYNELVAGTGQDKSGYDKIRFCGARAAADGLQYFWVDTCCIDSLSAMSLVQPSTLCFTGISVHPSVTYTYQMLLCQRKLLTLRLSG